MCAVLITKSTGEKEIFDPSKLVSSLRKAGATDGEANKILYEVERVLVDGASTVSIYKHAFGMLRHSVRHVAARYSMKRAIAELGPNGFPFEKFIAEIYKAQGFEAVTDQVVRGECVEHEVDVVAWKGDDLAMVEAKFHNEPGLKSDLKVALYVKARFDDLRDGTYEYGGKKRKVTSWELVTNTKFTETAIRYAECRKLPLIGWNYPREGNLEDLVSKYDLHPITSLTTLTGSEKRALIDKGFILAKHIAQKPKELESLGIDTKNISAVLDEVKNICKTHG